jgi:hypothetical protein
LVTSIPAFQVEVCGKYDQDKVYWLHTSMVIPRVLLGEFEKAFVEATGVTPDNGIVYTMTMQTSGIDLPMPGVVGVKDEVSTYVLFRDGNVIFGDFRGGMVRK